MGVRCPRGAAPTGVSVSGPRHGCVCCDCHQGRARAVFHGVLGAQAKVGPGGCPCTPHAFAGLLQVCFISRLMQEWGSCR